MVLNQELQIIHFFLSSRKMQLEDIKFIVANVFGRKSNEWPTILNKDGYAI